MSPELLRAAEKSRSLAGSRIRAVPAAWALGLSTVATLAGLVIAATGPLGSFSPFLTPLGLCGFALYWRVFNKGMRTNNHGVALLNVRDFEGAERAFVSLVSTRGSRTLAAFGLYNLGYLALRRGDFDDTVVLARAARACLGGGSMMLPVASTRALLAFGLACKDDLDGAEKELGTGPEPGSSAVFVAAWIRTRAFIAFRRRRFDEVLAILDADRVLLMNTNCGSEAALIEAMEAAALQNLGGACRGTSRHSWGLSYDDDARQFVARALPGCESVLASN